MKFLSLNAHSWCEADQPAKIMDTARLIVSEAVDVVALQEANQLQGGVPWRSEYFCGPSTLAVGADNYAQALAAACAHLGEPYHCYWAEAHRGFGKYDEGVGVLVRRRVQPRPSARARAVVLADYAYEDVRRRVALAVPGEGWGWVLSGHFSWWASEGQQLFAREWRAVEEFAGEHAGERICVLGDFNNPTTVEGEGYSLVRGLGWLDARDGAREVAGHDTIPGRIVGWEQAEGGARIDYALVNHPVPVRSHRVVLDGVGSPVVSDHYGVLVEIEAQEKGTEEQ